MADEAFDQSAPTWASAVATESYSAHDGSAPPSAREARARAAAASRLSAPARIKFFEELILSHQTLDHIYQGLIDAIHLPGRRRMIFLYGPTGVGKSTVLNRIVRHYELAREQALDAKVWNPGHLPILRMDVPAMGERAVSFLDIYERLLTIAQEPLIEHKTASERSQIWRSPAGGKHARERDLRWALESMIRHRQPTAILLDEAQHFAEHRSANGIESQLNCLASLASIGHVTWILAGSYELIPLQNRNAQLSSRSRHLHFPRYRLEKAADVKEFCRVVWFLSDLLPFDESPDLSRYWELLYRFSGGIVGIVKQWLLDALNLAIQEQATTVNEDHLRRTAYDLSQVSTIIQQAVKGETDIAAAQSAEVLRSIEAVTRLSQSGQSSQQALTSTSSPARPEPGPVTVPGMVPGAVAALVNTESSAASHSRAQSQRTGAQRSQKKTDIPANPPKQSSAARSLGSRGRRRVGERNPVRDPVGRPPDGTTSSRYRI